MCMPHNIHTFHGMKVLYHPFELRVPILPSAEWCIRSFTLRTWKLFSTDQPQRHGAPLSYIAAATVSPIFTASRCMISNYTIQHRTHTMNPEMVSLTTTNAPSQSDHATILLPLPYSCVWALVRTTYERNEGKVQGPVRVKCYRSWFYRHMEADRKCKSKNHEWVCRFLHPRL